MSDPLATVQAALAAVMADVQAVAKSDRNESQGFRFRGVDAVVNAVGPALRKHSLIVVPRVDEVRESTVEVGRNRTPMGHVTVIVRYVFVGPDGSELETRVVGEAMDSGDKAVAKAMSVALRIALLQALALPTDEPDPDSVVYERSAPPPQMTATQHTEITGWLSGLDGDTAAEVKVWWKSQKLPKADRLSEEQAAQILEHLAEHTPARVG